MTRRILATAAAAIALAAGVSGCGIPDQTDVQVDGRVPELAYGSVDGNGNQPPERSNSGDDPQRFAVDFLKAAAGEASGAYARVKKYIAESSQSKLKEKQGSDIAINVVRLREPTPRFSTDGNGITTITIPVDQIGVLKTNGMLAPPVATDTEYSFTVGKLPVGEAKPSSGLFVLAPPPVLLMSTDALKEYYKEQTIYFWNVDRTALVPDLRYLPVAVPRQGRATEVLSWLTSGPPEWLASTTLRLPDGTEPIGNVTQTGSRTEVSLSALPGPDEELELNRLVTQLVWSLPDLDGQLEVKIRNQSRQVIDNTNSYRRSHAVYQMAEDPQRFCVYAGAVHPLASPGEVIPPVPIAPEVNHNVTSAALARGRPGVLAALVSPVDEGRRLLVGSGVDQVRAVKQSAKTYASMSRPVWLKAADLKAADPIGLVVADGKLYQFGTEAALTELRLPNAAGGVTAVGGALDGHRIAFIAGGGLYVAALAVDGGRITVGPARRLATSLRNLTSVEWSRENSLVVAGTKARTAIYEITVDGALETTLDDDTGARVTHLSAYPDNPVLPPAAGRVMYEANAVAWRDRYSTFERITPDQVAGAPASPPAGASANPTAPFFFY